MPPLPPAVAVGTIVALPETVAPLTGRETMVVGLEIVAFPSEIVAP